MSTDTRSKVDFDETGAGDAIVLVPGSCSTGAAWRPVVSHLRERYRCITTSLPGYGDSSERRTSADTSIARVAEAVEEVIARAAAPVHLVGHSFGGLVALAVALRRRAIVKSLTMLEPPAVRLLDDPADTVHALAFRSMSDDYLAAHARGEPAAISAMIDFYGGDGTFASWPERVRSYAIETTPVNLVDWKSAFGFPLTSHGLRALGVPAVVVCGGDSHPAMHRITESLATAIGRTPPTIIANAAHFMIATHAAEVARAIDGHIASLSHPLGHHLADRE